MAGAHRDERTEMLAGGLHLSNELWPRLIAPAVCEVYPHMTVRENMSFALKIAKKSQAEIDVAVDKAAKIL